MRIYSSISTVEFLRQLAIRRGRLDRYLGMKDMDLTYPYYTTNSRNMLPIILDRLNQSKDKVSKYIGITYSNLH